MTNYPKPLPNLDDRVTAPFWAGTRSSVLLVQTCEQCGYRRWPPGPVCPECWSREMSWRPVEPVGSLVTYCVYYRALAPGFADDVPYAVGLVQLADGPRMYGSMVGDLSTLKIDRPVHGIFDAVTAEITLVRWAMSTSNDQPGTTAEIGA